MTSHAPPRAMALEILARCDGAPLKELAEELLETQSASVEVLLNRTGLVMVPMRDTVEGTDFFLGEVLVAEAHIRLGAREGYGLRAGHDLEAAMAMAIADLCFEDPRVSAFIALQQDVLTAADEDVLRAVEATRVEMETF